MSNDNTDNKELQQDSINNEEKLIESPKEEISQEKKELLDTLNKRKYAIDRLKEIKNLFNYIESVHCKNRQEKKQFRRDFIKVEDYPSVLIDTVIKFYDVGVKKENVR